MRNLLWLVALAGVLVNPGPAFGAGGSEEPANPGWVRLPSYALRNRCPVSYTLVPPKETSLSRSLITRAFRDHKGQVRWCAQRARQAGRRVTGTLVVSGRVEPDGSLTQLRTAESDLADEAVERCVLEAMGHWRLPAVKGPRVAASAFRYPFVLTELDEAAPPESVGAAAEASTGSDEPPTLSPGADQTRTRLEERLAALAPGDSQRVKLRRQLAAVYAEEEERVWTDPDLEAAFDAEFEAEERGDTEAEARLREAAEQRLLEAEARSRALLSAALAQYEHILSEHPDGPEADVVLYAASLLSWELKRRDEAAPRLSALLRRYPDSSHAGSAALLLGQIWLDRGRFDDAAEVFRRAAAADDPSVALPARVHLGWALFNAGHDHEALRAAFTAAGALAGRLPADSELAHELRRNAARLLVLSYAVAGPPAEAPARLGAIPGADGRALALGVLAQYGDMGRHAAATELATALLKDESDLSTRIALHLSLAREAARRGDAEAAVMAAGAAAADLRRDEAPSEDTAWATRAALLGLAQRYDEESRVTGDPATARSAREAYAIFAEAFPESDGVPEALFRRAALGRTAGLSFDEVADEYTAVQARAPGARWAVDAADEAFYARISAALCDSRGRLGIPRIDELVPRPVEALVGPAHKALELFVSALANDERGDRFGSTSSAYALYGKALYAYNDFAGALPYLEEAWRRAAPGSSGYARLAARLLSAYRLACERTRMVAFLQEIRQDPKLLDDRDLAELVPWLEQHPEDLDAHCPAVAP